MASEPYQPEPMPELSATIPLKDAARIIRRDRFCLACGHNVRGRSIEDDCPECGRAILAREPVLAGAPPAPTVDEPAAPPQCDQCGYDLRGLPLGGVCPECGMAKSPAVGASLIDPFSRMPMAVIKQFRAACLLASVVMLSGIVLLIQALLNVAQPTVLGVMLLCVAIAWFGAVWLATPGLQERPGIVRGFSSQNLLRHAVRVLQLGWVIAAVCSLVIELLPRPSPIPLESLAVLRWIGAAVGLAGLWCFAVLMARLSEWTRDDLAERMFNLSLWGIPLGTPPLLFLNVGWLLGWSYMAVMIRGPIQVLIVLLGLAWMIALVAFPLAMLSLTKSVALSVMHHREHRERQRRRLARNIEYDERLSAALERMDRPTGIAGPDQRR